MSSRWKDVKVRANDIQVGDYLYFRGSYEEVMAVQHGVPMEGFVRFELGEMGNPEADRLVCFVLGVDSMTAVKKSGDPDTYQWVQLPAGVKEALPALLQAAIQYLDAAKAAIKTGAPRQARKDYEEMAAQVAVAGLWVATTVDQKRFERALREFVREVMR